MVALNLFERSIATFAPEWGIKRLSAKVGLVEAQVLARGYDAARRDRRTENWRATGGSANAELGGALDTVRRRSRDLCRNNEWAVNAKRKWVAHLIGTGIVPRPDLKEKAAKTAARDAWTAFNENCDPEGLSDFYGLQARLAGEVFEGGAAFLRWYTRPSSFGLKVPLQCEVLEHDFLDTRRTEIRGDNVVIHGVEYDPYGRRVAYWLFPSHPGELSIIRRGGFVSQRVGADVCDHVFRVDRAGQVTGVPWLAPTMLRLRDLGDWEEAELIRKKIEACFTVFVRRDGSGSSGLAQAAGQRNDQQGRRIEKIAPGLIAYVDGVGDIETAAPTPTNDGGHTDRQLYAFAAGAGLTYSQVSGNLSNVNFTSLREGKLDSWPVVDQAQLHMVVPQACRPAWRRVMRTSAARGLGVMPDTSAIWSPPKRPWVNPADDLKATAGELALGLESWPDLVAARGYDPEELLEEISEWQAKLQAAGLSVGAAPGIASLPPPAATADNTSANKG